MSLESAKEFIERVKTDEEFAKQVASRKDEELMKFVSEQEVKQIAEELSDDELESVAGGGIEKFLDDWLKCGMGPFALVG